MATKRNGQQKLLLAFGLIVIAFSVMTLIQALALLEITGLAVRLGLIDGTTLTSMHSANALLADVAGGAVAAVGIIGVIEGAYAIVASGDTPRLKMLINIIIVNILVTIVALVLFGLAGGDITSNVISVIFNVFLIWVAKTIQNNQKAA